MIIKSIEIQNFRSYYKDNGFEFSNRLNLIIGSNGDGKTTFYEALEWLFRTDGTNNMDAKLISKKRSEELLANESDDVRVSMTYEHKGATKTLEKMFHFTKSFDGAISLSNYSFKLIESNGVERISREGIRFDYDLPSEVRKYTMFKGESNLDVFQNSNALKMLIETFSDVRDFEAYFSFMELATAMAERARDNAQKNDRRNAEKIRQIQYALERASGKLSDIRQEMKQKQVEATNFETLLRDIEQSKEASEQLTNVNCRIETLRDKRAKTRALVDENYTVKLLDDMWVLMGFKDIAEEYSDKVSAVDKMRRKIESEYLMMVGADKLIQKVQRSDLGFVPLLIHVPGQKFVEEMLEEEVCKICGRPAPKNSDAWNYMFRRLEEYKGTLKVDEDEEIKPYYKNNYVVELQKRETILNDNLAEIAKYPRIIREDIAFNNKRQDEVKKIDENIAREEEQKKRILAQADGLSEEKLLASYQNVSRWFDQKNRANNRIEELKREEKRVDAEYRENLAELEKLAEGTSAEIYAKISLIIRQISDAFKEAKESNKKRLLHAIEDEANSFLEKLNVDDFTGVIRIIEKANGQGEAILNDSDGTRIFTPNTALRTTYLMSVLFAIGKLSSERDKTEFPLIFDAPTSSFTDAKERDFFNVIGTINKQVIIVTKSFLKEGSKGEFLLDNDKIKDIIGSIYRIEKQRPFNDKDLSTIQTVISKIK